jgi:hypothetical protein
MSIFCSSKKTSSKLLNFKLLFKEFLNFLSKTFKIFYEYLILKLLFHLILNLILCSFVIFKQIKIYLKQLLNYKKDLIDCCYERHLIIPNHVCFIINEELNKDEFKNISICLTKKFTSIGVKLFTFYTHDG